MTSDSSVVPLRQPDAVEDPLTAVLREGARRLLAQAIEAEADSFLASMRDGRLPDGRERIVRHGHGPERVIQTGIGPVDIRGSTGAVPVTRTAVRRWVTSAMLAADATRTTTTAAATSRPLGIP